MQIEIDNLNGMHTDGLKQIAWILCKMKKMIDKIVFLALFGLAMSVGSELHAASPFPVPGGSNYAWYQVSSCDREPYGVIANYNTQSSIINSQLATMYANGQQRLRIPIFFAHGGSGGTLMDSTGGNLSYQNQQNLINFLAAVKNAGFTEVEIAFFPIGKMNEPTQWSAYNEDYFQENWNVIANLHPIFVASGIPYKIDLHNEGIPSPSETGSNIKLQYDQHLWNNYVAVFGKNDTVGFSIIPETDRLNNAKNVYGDSQYGNHGTPYLFDIHIYDNPNNSAANQFVNADSILSSIFPPMGWIVGETYYNDYSSAVQFKQASMQTGRTIFYVAQWPETKDQACSDVDTVPLQYNNYLSGLAH